MNVTEAKGHWCGTTYDGRIKYTRDSVPDVIVVNGRMYQYVPSPAERGTDRQTPEDHLTMEVR